MQRIAGLFSSATALGLAVNGVAERAGDIDMAPGPAISPQRVDMHRRPRPASAAVTPSPIVRPSCAASRPEPVPVTLIDGVWAMVTSPRSS
ncbi:MAG: hypothetical protein U1E67_12845 [Hyphomicrobiales bacterium]